MKIVFFADAVIMSNDDDRSILSLVGGSSHHWLSTAQCCEDQMMMLMTHRTHKVSCSRNHFCSLSPFIAPCVTKHDSLSMNPSQHECSHLTASITPYCSPHFVHVVISTFTVAAFHRFSLLLRRHDHDDDECCDDYRR
jgi:hypothetical protein